jgi:predicted glycosyltransferase
VPLSHYICYPWIIPRSIWTELGANRNSLAPYRALDAAAWLKGFKPDPRIMPSLGLDRDRPVIFLRTEEAFAAYLMGKATDRAPVVLPIIKELLRRQVDAQIVVSTRYGLQAPILKKNFHNQITILDHIVDSPSLLAHSAMFVGSGGTMTVEAALLGTIAISCFPGQKPLYISYLEKKKLVDTIFSPKQIASKAADALTNPEKYTTRGDRGSALLNWMEDPAQQILAKITDSLRKPLSL